jgi:post-segregation antitoxin (ccd killing protein)
MTERIIIELDAEAIAAARAANIDLSELLISALRRRIPTLHAAEREKAAREWYEENKLAVDSCNELFERHGLFSDGVREF